MPTFGEILDRARTHLDDDKAVNWQDYRILPKLQEAYTELKITLQMNGDQLTREVSAVLDVPANTTDLTTVVNYPTDLVEPIWLKERQVNQQNQDFADMVEVRFIPNAQQTTTLNWWAWRSNKIYLLGSLNAEQVQLRYRRNLTDPTLVSASLDVIEGETFLTYRTAALALQSIKDMRWKDLDTIAKNNLQMVEIQAAKKAQNLPTKRIGYHRRYWNTRGMWW
jgi:hypothetical protein